MQFDPVQQEINFIHAYLTLHQVSEGHEIKPKISHQNIVHMRTHFISDDRYCRSRGRR